MRVLRDGLLDGALAAAREAARAILEIYESGDVRATLKADASPLTAADRIANDLICSRLHALDAAIPILAEESDAVPYEARAAWECFWLVDPLDGTKEFLKRNGEFTVNIALVVAGRPALGVIVAPVLETAYFANAGNGAWREDPTGRAALRCSDYRAAGLRVVASRSHAGDAMPAFLAALGHPPAQSRGSSLKLCAIAEGSANLYPRFGPTMEWDVAAADCIVAEAGGSVVDLEGEPLRYNKPSLLNPSFVAAGAPPYPWRAALPAGA